jgi:3-dehydroquinate dehydratase type I
MICLSTKSTDLLFLHELSPQVEYVELRADIVSYPIDELRNILQLNHKFIIKVIPDNTEYFNAVLDLSPDYIDIDLKYISGLCKSIFNKVRPHLIISHHYYNYTPDIFELKSKLDEIKEYSPGIIKIVSFANSEVDNNSILSLYNHKGKFALLAFAMGSAGKPTRLQSIKLGAPWMYVSYDKESQTAPGQFDLNEAMELLKGDKHEI